jgi:PAS domain S-box-containing protein
MATPLPAGLGPEFRLLFDATPIPLLVLTPDFTMVAANEARLSATMTTREQILGRYLFDLFPDNPDDATATGTRNLRASLDRVLRTRETDAMPIQKYDIPKRGPAESGFEVRYWKPVNAPVLDAAGEVIYIIHCVEDVTEQVLKQHAAEAGEARFRQIADAIPQMVWSALPNGYHDYYNRRHYEFAGVPASATIGDNLGAILHPDDLARTERAWKHSLRTGAPYEIEYRLRHRSGDYHWMLARALPIRNEAGDIERWMGTCTDINDQKVLQAALQDAQARLEGTLAAAEVGTWTWDIEADRVHADRNFARMFQVSDADADGGPSAVYLAMIDPDDRRPSTPAPPNRSPPASLSSTSTACATRTAASAICRRAAGSKPAGTASLPGRSGSCSTSARRRRPSRH